MKILHTADWHLGKRLMDHSRLEEQAAVMQEIVDIADREEVDAVLVAGDLYDTFNPSIEATEIFYKTFRRLSNNGQRLVLAIAGNHDSPDRIDAPDPLARELGIIFVGRPLAKVPLLKLDTGLEILHSDEGFIEVKLPNQADLIRIIHTPYVNELTLKKYLGEEDKEEEMRQILTDHWQGLATKYCDDKGVNILVTHLYMMEKEGVPPEEPDDEKSILYMGGAQAIYTESIPVQMQYAALGHLHRYQSVSKKPCPVVYSSSPLEYSFSEAHQQKYVMLLDAEPGKEVVKTAIPLTQGKKLFRKRFETLDTALEWLRENPDCFVELTLVSDTFIDAAIKKQLYEIHDGIVQIIPELTGNKEQQETRKPIDLDKNRTELFKDFFQQKKGQEPSEEMMNLFREVIGSH